MFADVMGTYGSRLVVAVLGVGLALICLVGILWIVRGRRGPSPFVRGGRNRQPRLQVLDAAAVDTRRRLVLVRRDDVEHLIMIGGPTDIVIESGIFPATRSTEARVPEQAAPSPTTAQAPRSIAHDTPRAAAQPALSRPEPARDAVRELAARELAARETAAREPRLPAQSLPAAPSPAMASPIAVTAVPARIEPSVTEDLRGAAVSTAPRQPLLDDAARLLDSQRDRVFAERGAPPPAPTARPVPIAVSVQASTPVMIDRAVPLGSDFDKILEQEMANNMAERDAAQIVRANRLAAQGGSALPAPGQVAAPAAAAVKNDPSLQSEVARIFGEMSASREK
jgi:hypothetical protein